MNLISGTLFGAGLFLIFIGLVMLLPHRLNKRQKETISKVGLMHFTTQEAADKIINSSVITANKIRCAYFFQNGTVSVDAIEFNNLSSKSVGVEILNLTEEQLNHLTIRYYDMAVVNFGDFYFSKSNQISIKTESDITPIRLNLWFYLKISFALLIVGIIVLGVFFEIIYTLQ
ncbi:MAG: hypothetical protein ACI4JS_06215 [Oscillospiraceae bacterium]